MNDLVLTEKNSDLFCIVYDILYIYIYIYNLIFSSRKTFKNDYILDKLFYKNIEF